MDWCLRRGYLYPETESPVFGDRHTVSGEMDRVSGDTVSISATEIQLLKYLHNIRPLQSIAHQRARACAVLHPT